MQAIKQTLLYGSVQQQSTATHQMWSYIFPLNLLNYINEVIGIKKSSS